MQYVFCNTDRQYFSEYWFLFHFTAMQLFSVYRYAFYIWLIEFSEYQVPYRIKWFFRILTLQNLLRIIISSLGFEKLQSIDSMLLMTDLRDFADYRYYIYFLPLYVREFPQYRHFALYPDFSKFIRVPIMFLSSEFSDFWYLFLIILEGMCFLITGYVISLDWESFPITNICFLSWDWQHFIIPIFVIPGLRVSWQGFNGVF